MVMQAAEYKRMAWPSGLAQTIDTTLSFITLKEGIGGKKLKCKTEKY